MPCLPQSGHICPCQVLEWLFKQDHTGLLPEHAYSTQLCKLCLPRLQGHPWTLHPQLGLTGCMSWCRQPTLALHNAWLGEGQGPLARLESLVARTRASAAGTAQSLLHGRKQGYRAGPPPYCQVVSHGMLHCGPHCNVCRCSAWSTRPWHAVSAEHLLDTWWIC